MPTIGSLEIGVYASCTDETPRPDEVAILVEQAGLDVLRFGEHTQRPAAAQRGGPAEHLFPQNGVDRARAARHLALLVERWGQRDLAHWLCGSDGIPHDSDEALQAPSRPDDHIQGSRTSERSIHR